MYHSCILTYINVTLMRLSASLPQSYKNLSALGIDLGIGFSNFANSRAPWRRRFQVRCTLQGDVQLGAVPGRLATFPWRFWLGKSAINEGFPHVNAGFQMM